MTCTDKDFTEMDLVYAFITGNMAEILEYVKKLETLLDEAESKGAFAPEGWRAQTEKRIRNLFSQHDKNMTRKEDNMSS